MEITEIKIDTHHHIVPPDYSAWLASHGVTAGGLPIPAWTVEGSLDLMETEGTSQSILSVSTPGVHFGDDREARQWARKVNEYAANVVERHSARFGFFATLTLPDVEGAVSEAAYAFDELKADGVVLLTNVGGRYLGDALFEPLLDELNRRHSVVFIHPNELPCVPVDGIPPYVADFLLDTTRAAINIAKAGWLERFPNVAFVLSHAGGFLPFAAQRVARAVSDGGADEIGIKRLQQFYFDTALASSPYALAALLAFADPHKIFFGSDWPHAPKQRSVNFTKLLEGYEMDDVTRRQIYRQNAQRMFPRFAA